ncbi:ChaN family lipoprotein [Noviherbaspirillum sp. ST9]|uniref:ChaN family lipoprotein n=1 Tax=Noviherbaspirillum sp. ST9 TaxID=3401606 RepID=UPI003B58710A
MNTLKKLARTLFCAITVASLASCAHFSNPYGTQHPLAGKIWDVANNRFVEPDEVIGRATESKFVLLGEIHDNEEHHRIQAMILDAVVKSGRKPALVMEQFDVDQQKLVNGIVQGNGSRMDKLRDLSKLMRQGWNWPLYQRLVSSALQQKLPLVAANLSREAVREVARNGYEVLGTGEESRLALDTTWTPERDRQLAQEIAAGHCGKVADHMVQIITKSQRVRDAVMADKMLMARRSGVVGIVGRGHAREDLGVPLYLAARAPEESVLSVGMVEVYEPVDPNAYAHSAVGAHHDYLWFTPRPARNSNPCDSIPAPKAES